MFNQIILRLLIDMLKPSFPRLLFLTEWLRLRRTTKNDIVFKLVLGHKPQCFVMSNIGRCKFEANGKSWNIFSLNFFITHEVVKSNKKILWHFYRLFSPTWTAFQSAVSFLCNFYVVFTFNRDCSLCLDLQQLQLLLCYILTLFRKLTSFNVKYFCTKISSDIIRW